MSCKTPFETRLTLPYSHISYEDRKEYLFYRIASYAKYNGFPELDQDKAVYKIVHGKYEKWNNDNSILLQSFPFSIEVIAVPIASDEIQYNLHLQSQFIGSVNYSLSPRDVEGSVVGNKFDGDKYYFTNPDDKKQYYAENIAELLQHGFKFNFGTSGGKHTLETSENYDTSGWNAHWSYDASVKNAVSFEFIHPQYENGYTVIHYKRYKPLGDKWFGCKVVSMVRPDQSARDIVTYFNEDPVDLTTGKPKNDGWKKYIDLE